MASASVVLRHRTTAEPGDSWESLKAATDDFESILTEQQCTELRKIKIVPDSDAVMVFTAQLDAASRSRKGRSIATRLHSVLQSVQQFASIVDTLVSSHPEIAALVWGSVKFAMLLVSNYTSYFEELSQVFMRFNSYCPIFEEYQALFPTSKRVQEALCKFYVSIIQCCKHAVEAIQRPWQTQILNIFRQSFDKEFESDILSIRNNGKQVKEEIKLAQIQMERQYQELQKLSQAVVRSDLRNIMSGSKLVNERLEDIKMTQYLHKTRKRDQRLLESLSTHDYSTPLKEACKIRNCNTATWIFSTPEFTSWTIQQGTSLLWCSGKIGSGKTVVTASVIQHLFMTKHKSICITYFFAQYHDAQSLKAETILRSIVRQTLNPMDLSEKIKTDLKDLDGERFLQFEKVVELLKDRVMKFDCFYIILDGLDECDPSERRVLLDAISSLISMKPKLKVFLASRIGLQGEIERRLPNMTRVSMEVSGAVLDISVYIRENIQQRMLDRQLVMGDPKLAEEIERRLTMHADGMFLWVSYLLDELCDQCSDNDIRKALNNLPKSLKETYCRVLSRITPGRAPTVQRIFQWISVAKRRLTFDELSEAVYIEVGQKYSDTSKRLNESTNLAIWSENLLHINEENTAVYFAHQSIYDFMTSTNIDDDVATFHVNIEAADHNVGEICLTYLHFNDFQTTLASRLRPATGISPASIPTTAFTTNNRVWNSTRRLIERKVIKKNHDDLFDLSVMPSYDRASTDATLESFQARYPFLNYASQHWISHTKTFQDGKSRGFKLWKRIVTEGHPLTRRPWLDSDNGCELDANTLGWAVQAEHFALVRQQLFGKNCLLKRDQEVSMIQAAAIGSQALMELFLQLEQSSWALNTSLQLASKHGHLEIVKLLLCKDAYVNAYADPDYGNHTALQAAAGHGHFETAECLIAAGADVNAHWPAISDVHLADLYNIYVSRRRPYIALDQLGGEWFTALQAAAKGGHRDVVRLLLEHGAEPNARPASCDGLTALQAAAKYGHLHIVEDLIRHGAKINAASASTGGCTALQGAALNGHLQIVEDLIRHGAKINAASASTGGYTALQGAALNGHMEVLKYLIEMGAQVIDDSIKYKKLSALQGAALNGHLEIVEYLLARQADINEVPDLQSGLNAALSAAALGGHMKILRRLHDGGARIDGLTDLKRSLTALQAACKGGHPDIVKFLLTQGADANHESACYGLTALQAAAVGGNCEIIEMTLTHLRTSINDSGGFGPTALQLAVEHGHLGAFRLLLVNHANVNARINDSEQDYQGPSTALEAASQNGFLEIVHDMLTTKADLKNFHPWALALAAGCGHLDVVKCLVAKGAEVDYAKKRSTALHLAVRGGHLDIVKYLVAEKASINLRDDFSRPPLQLAAGLGHLSIFQFLLGAGASMSKSHRKAPSSPLQDTAAQGHIEIVRYLLLHMPKDNGDAEQALKKAARFGHLSIVKLLLAEGVSVNGPNFWDDYTPLQGAALGRHLEVVRYLLAAKATINPLWQLEEGLTALQAAAAGGRLDIVQLLVAENADINAPSAAHYGCTALQAACLYGHLEIVNYLIIHQANINAPPPSGGHTALQAACEGGHLHIVKHLIHHGADIHASADKNGRTALQAASLHKSSGIYEYLINNGAT
ncbi:unnamed protein product [Clonostachys rhizophaga]|uniref:NACHT domain-containing protein n=1 Tax=Clonostachys rhizophaga TaxID=160324 RepID=A0A9N9W002_9HYPO|nr:unnamed protein product [Clonostachys rhizophaga]